MPIRPRHFFPALLAGCLLAACTTPMPGTPAAYPAMPRASAPGFSEAFSGLIGTNGAVTTDEAEVRELLKRTTAIPFPARLGTMFLNYDPPITEEEKMSIMEKFGEDLRASGLVKTAAMVPNSLGMGPNVEGLRKLAARLQMDVLLLVNGTSEFKRSDVQPGGWFSAFSNAANFEARTSLVAFYLDVYSGTVLAPITALGSTAPTLLDPTAGNFSAEQKRLNAEAVKMAADKLKASFINSLKQVQTDQQEQAAAPPASPAPAATPTPTPAR